METRHRGNAALEAKGTMDSSLLRSVHCVFLPFLCRSHLIHLVLLSSVHPGTEIPLVSSFLSSCAASDHGAPRQTPAAAERPGKKRERRKRRIFT